MQIQWVSGWAYVMGVVLPDEFTPAQISNGKCNSSRSMWFSLREGAALGRKSPVVTPYTAEAPSPRSTNSQLFVCKVVRPYRSYHRDP